MPEKCTESCPHLDKLAQEVQSFRDQNSDTHKEIFQRLNKLEQGEAAQNVQYSNIMLKLDELTKKVEALEAKPAKRWDKLLETVLVAVVTGVVAYLLGRAGL